jgi:hypothetical protein
MTGSRGPSRLLGLDVLQLVFASFSVVYELVWRKDPLAELAVDFSRDLGSEGSRSSTRTRLVVSLQWTLHVIELSNACFAQKRSQIDF